MKHMQQSNDCVIELGTFSHRLLSAMTQQLECSETNPILENRVYKIMAAHGIESKLV
jgi:hypothetical protein